MRFGASIGLVFKKHLRASKVGHVRLPVLVLALALLLLGGCTHPRDHQPEISRSLEQRTGGSAGAKADPLVTDLPPGVDLNRPLSIDEAVAVALWNNAGFQAALTQLGFTRAEVIRGGQLTNPTFSLLFPVDPKQLEFAVLFPIEAIWLRPRRVAIAETEAAALAQQLVANGLDAVRSVRLACIDWDLARTRLETLGDSARVRAEIAVLAEARLAAGDASGLQLATNRVEAAQARQELVRWKTDLELAEQRVRALLGLATRSEPLQLAPLEPPVHPPAERETLESMALAARPELRAAELVLEAAGRRIGLSKAELFTFKAILDENGWGDSFQIGPGLEVSLPIFHQNQAARALADAEVARAARLYVVSRDQIIEEVREAMTRMIRTGEERDAWSRTVSLLDRAAGQGHRAYELGELSRLDALTFDRRLADARGQALAVSAAYRRAQVELERAIGFRLAHPLMAPAEPGPEVTYHAVAGREAGDGLSR